MSVYDEHIAGEDEDCGVAVGQGRGLSQCGKDAIGNLFDVEQIGGCCL